MKWFICWLLEQIVDSLISQRRNFTHDYGELRIILRPYLQPLTLHPPPRKEYIHQILKGQAKFTADYILGFFFLFFIIVFLRKKKSKLLFAAVVIGALRVNVWTINLILKN